MIKRKLLEKLVDELNGIVAENDHLTIQEIQGFFYALAITPPSLLPEQWEYGLFKNAKPTIELKQLENLMIAAFEIYDSYVQLRNAGQLTFPFDIDHLKGKQIDWIRQWCRGFWIGLALCKDFWFGATDDTEETDLYWNEVGHSARLFDTLITRDYSKLPDIAASEQALTDDALFRRVLLSIPAAIEKLQHVIDDIEAELEEQKTIGQPAYRPKLSRHDPCPCGSGKRYKQCCLS
ncbi:MAG: YecA family protein [Methylomicrobium sp.]